MLLNYKFMNYFIKNFKFIILTKLLLKRHINATRPIPATSKKSL